MTVVPPPTQAGFLLFVRNQMQITTTVLPDNNEAISTSFQVAMEIVNQTINLVSPVIYTLMVYNLGGSNIINFAVDAPGASVFKTDGNGITYTFFEWWRKFFGCSSFIGGTIASTSDEGTSESLNVPDGLKNLTIADLQYLKDPWGRQYLAFAQRYGTGWGLT